MQLSTIDAIFYIVILIMSVVVHEFAHGYVAYLLGDRTAHDQGRLTLNPLKHLDPFGSVILPLLLVAMQANFLIGWARPVPYNQNNLRNKKTGTIWVAVAGILANILLAVIFGLLIRFGPILGFGAYTGDSLIMVPFYKIAIIVVQLNLVLALFNLVPIPPLDGSKILFALLPGRFRYIENFLEQWGVFILLLFIFTLWQFVAPLINIAFYLITGL
jgi:Zn-dependent protease